MEFKGIDVSTHQGTIDWEKVKADGIQFALIRASYGSKSVDAQFKRNADECTRLNIPFGAYLYSYARNTEEAKNEVQNFINAIKPYKLSYPAIIDMEDADSYKSKNGVSYATCIDICEVECIALEQAGYYAMIYANLDWLNNKINSSRLDRFDKWVAQWNSSCNYSKPYGIWQYTSSGKVEGINGNVDMNKSYKDYPSIIAGMKSNNTSAEVTQKSIEELANEVINGKWGVGEDRKKRLTEAGYNYDTVQAKVNEIMGVTQKSIEELADEVISGKWGVGEDRKKRLTEAGYDYDTVQAKVNEKMGVNNSSSEITYTVKKGDTLSSIASKYNTTWQKIYEKNKSAIGSNPNLIHAGLKLKI